MNASAALALDTIETAVAPVSIPLEIERFLDGDTDGELLFGLLYDDVLDEPVPERLRAICRVS
jgi:hypothetical protein